MYLRGLRVSIGAEQNVQLLDKRDIWKNPLIFITVIMLYNDVLSGVLRYAYQGIGAVALAYVPFACAILFIVLHVSVKLFVGKADYGDLFIPFFFAAYALYSFFKEMPVNQLVFGLYIWTPFFIGALVVHHKAEGAVLKHFGLLWLIAVFGVLLNNFVDVPWVGSSYDVAGLTVDVAQDWNAEGVARLVGFSRAHYTVANEIIFTFAFLFMSRISVYLKLIIWGLSISAEYLTTSKVDILIVCVTPVFLFTFDFLRARGKGYRSLAFTYAVLLLTFLMVVEISLPFILSDISVWVGDLDLSGSVQFMTTSSLFDRALYMWPDAFEQLHRDRMPMEWIFGRGLGGIGAAQRVVDTEYFNSADNFFVYLYITLGVPGMTFFIFILSKLQLVFNKDEAFFRVLFALAVPLLIAGVTACNVEGVFPAFVFGILVGKALTKRYDNPQPAPVKVRKGLVKAFYPF